MVFTAFLTAFYMFRLWFLTFGGEGGAFGGLVGRPIPRRRHRPCAGDAHHAASVDPGGALGYRGLLGLVGGGGQLRRFRHRQSAGARHSRIPLLIRLTVWSVGAAVLGIGLAWAMYGLRVIPRDVLTRNPLGKGAYAVLFNKFYVDEIYLAFVRFVVMGLSRIAVGIDRYIIDGVINGLGRGVISLGSGLRRTESGRMQNYGAAIFGGALLIAAVFFAVVYINK